MLSTQARGVVEGVARAIGTQIWMPRWPVTFGPPRHAQVLERGAVEPGQHEHVVERGARAGVDVDERPRRLVRRRRRSTSTGAARRRRSWPSRRARRGDRPRRTTRSRRRRRRRSASGSATRARGRAAALCQKPGSSTPFGKRCRLSGRSARYGQHHRRDARVVADEVALGERRSSPRPGKSTLSRLVSAQLAALQRPTCPSRRARRAPRARRRSAPASSGARPRRRADRAGVQSARRGRRPPRRWCARSAPTRVLLGIPSRRRRTRRACAAAATAPCRSRAAPRRTSTKRPRSFSPSRSKCSSPASTRRGRIVGPVPAPRCPGPTRSRRRRRTRPAGITPSKSTYSSGWSSTWTASRRAVGSSVGPFGTAQLTSTPSNFQPQVVVQPAGPVALHHEPRPGCAGDSRTRSARASGRSRASRCSERAS